MNRALAFALIVLSGCAPAPSSPVAVMSMVLSSSGNYEPRQVELKTLDRLVALDGAIATLRGGANVLIDSNDPQLATSGTNLNEKQLKEIFVKNDGLEPRASFVESGGVFWPADFHSWNMVTSYYNFEQAFTYFQSQGIAAEALGDPTVYYFPTFVMADVDPNPLEDNALFFPPIQGFAILPFKTLQKVPLAMNSGVVAHEYSHWVFNQLAYGGRAFPDPFTRWIGLNATPELNLLKSLDEGLADYHAHGTTCQSPFGCNSRFIGASVSDAAADGRDFTKGTWCMSEGLRTALSTMSVVSFSGQGLEYAVGTIIASALHHAAAGNAQKREVLQRAILASYSDNTPSTPGIAQLISNNLTQPDRFTFPAVVNTFLLHIGDVDLRRDACTQFLDRLQLPRDLMPACPASASNGSACPVLPPQ
jgi:hypothetical protein